MKNKKICYITGTRADYGLMQLMLKEINKQFTLSLIVTGMHLSREFGYTVDEIEKDDFNICNKVDMLLSGDSGGAMAKSLAIAIMGITQALEKESPDFVLLLGDRGEALAGALAAAHLNIPIAHIHGGDQGDDGAHIDDSIRHSITKFAHIHLAATNQSAERIAKMYGP
jgi:GDP/UDP-N,N'-diacetylbacillosamine 2-epimerase (hydrolysing)